MDGEGCHHHRPGRPVLQGLERGKGKQYAKEGGMGGSKEGVTGGGGEGTSLINPGIL